MIAKLVKIFFLIYLLPVSTTFAQKRGISDTSTINKYNKWLKSIQLDKLIHASEIKTVKNLKSPDDTIRKISDQVSLVLILKPSANYTNMQDLATVWNYVADGLQEKGIDIYRLLLNKLADYTNTSLKLVKVDAQSAKPDIFSFKIYFDNKLEIEPHITLVMGGDIALDYDFNNTLKNTMTGAVQLSGGSINLIPYYDKITALFSKYRHEADSTVKFKKDIFNKGTLKFSVYNLYGQVTGEDYHERITLLVTVSDPVNDQVEINYEINAYCASGIKVVPKDDKSYHDVADEYPDRLSGFNNSFYKQFENIFNGKK